MEIVIDGNIFIENIIKAKIINKGKNKELITTDNEGLTLSSLIDGSKIITSQNINEGEEFIEDESVEVKNEKNEEKINDLKTYIDDMYVQQSEGGEEFVDNSTSYTTLGQRFDTDGSVIDDADWRISDYIRLDRTMTVTACAYENRVAIVTYDENKNILNVYSNPSVVEGNLGMFNTVLNPTNGYYVRYTSFGEFDDQRGYITYKKNYLDDIEEIKSTLEEYRQDIYFDRKISDAVILANKGKQMMAENSFSDSENWAVSDYIDISNGADITSFNGQGYYGIIYYDADKNFVGSSRVDTQSTINESIYTVTVKTNKGQYAYCKVSSNTAIEGGIATVTTIVSADNIVGEIVKTGEGSKTYHFTVPVNVDFPTYNDTDSISNTTLDTETMKDVECALMLPYNYSPTGTPTKLIVCMHGAGGYISSDSVGEMAYCNEKLLANGYAIMDCNGLPNDEFNSDGITPNGMHMGSSIALSAYRKAIQYVQNNFNVENQIFVHAHSMGALSALNFASKNSGIVKAIGLWYPVTDMYNQAWLHSWNDNVKTSIAKLYNFDDKTGATYEEDKVIGFNPINNHSIVINDTRYNNLQVPITIWHGNADVVVSLEGSQKLVTALKNSGCEAHLRVVDGFGHDISDAVKEEELMWYNRF